jgi:hypothetical protein
MKLKELKQLLKTARKDLKDQTRFVIRNPTEVDVLLLRDIAQRYRETYNGYLAAKLNRKSDKKLNKDSKKIAAVSVT